MNSDLVFYGGLLTDIKDRIRQAQTKATLSANTEMILMGLFPYTLSRDTTLLPPLSSNSKMEIAT